MATVPKKGKKAANEEPLCPTTEEDKQMILGVLDTYHDFCKSERGTKPSSDASSKASVASDDDDDEDEFDTKRIDTMREYLPKLLNKLYPDKITSVQGYQENIATLTCKQVKGVSGIEHQGVEMFESDETFRKALNAAPESKEILTFQQIIDAYEDSKAAAPKGLKEALLEKYSAGTANRILELSKSGRRFGKNKANEQQEKKEIEYLSDFILHYFFGADGLTKEIFMTFDAGQRVVGDIFHDRENVKCVIFPETLADSATTSLGMLNGRNEYVFPSTETKILFESNIFSKDVYTIEIVNTGFNEQNPYGFTLSIQHKTKPSIKLELPFSRKQNQGPSVNYLIDILKRAQENAEKRQQYLTKVAAEQKKPVSKQKVIKEEPYLSYGDIKRNGTILNLGEALDNNEVFRIEFETEVGLSTNGVIPDLKRAGDHEAVLASKKVPIVGDKYKYFIFCTIDILCALKSRIEQINTIWQGKDKIILYRYDKDLEPSKPKNPKDKFVRVGKEIYDIVSKIHTFQNVKISDGLDAQIAKCITAQDGLVNYSDRSKVPYYKQVCEEMLNALLRIAILDLSEYCQQLKTEGVKFEELSFPRGELSLEELAFLFLPFYSNEAGLLDKISDDGKYKTKVGTKSLELNLDDIKQKVVKYYQAIIEKTKEKLRLNIYSGVEQQRIKDNFLEQPFDIGKDLIIQRPNSSDSKKFDAIFLMEEHPVFQFIPAVFEKFYDHLMFIHDLSEKNKIKPSREYDKVIRKVLSNDVNAPFQFFKTVDEVIDQFKLDVYKEKIKQLIDLRIIEIPGTADQRLEIMKQYIVGDAILLNEAAYNALTPKQKEIYESETRRENGMVENIRNYYLTLQSEKGLPGNGFLTYEPPVESASTPSKRQQSKRVQRGGDPEEASIYQYYDLNSLLYRIVSQSAAFVESLYCENYPAYQFLHEFVSMDFTVSDEILKSKFQSLYTQIQLLRDDDRRVQRVIEFSSKNIKGDVGIQTALRGALGQLQRTLSHVFNKTTAIEQLYTVFHYLCKTQNDEVKSDGSNIVYPSVYEFLIRLSNIQYDSSVFQAQKAEIKRILNKTEELTEEELETLRKLQEIKLSSSIEYDDLSALWQYGLHEIRQNKDYIYFYKKDSRGFLSEELITTLLTLEVYHKESSAYTAARIFSEIENENGEALSSDPSKYVYQVQSYLGDSIFYPSVDERAFKKSTLLEALKPLRDLATTLIQDIGSAGGEVNIENVILFVFTLLENIMNKTGKKSFFLEENFRHRNYQTKMEWTTNLHAILISLITLVEANLKNGSKSNKLILAETLRGGGTRYPKQTKRKQHHSKSRKAKKYNKTRRHLKH